MSEVTDIRYVRGLSLVTNKLIMLKHFMYLSADGLFLEFPTFVLSFYPKKSS